MNQKMDSKLVNVIVGRFQPFTKRDFETAQGLSISNGLPVLVVYVRSHQGYSNTPLKSDTVRSMLTELTKLDMFCDVIYSDSWDYEEILRRVSKKGFKVFQLQISDHDSVQSQLARLSAQNNDCDMFCRCVPSNLHKYFGEFRKEILEYGKQI